MDNYFGKFALKLLALMGVVYLAVLTHNAAKQFDYIGRPTTQRDTIAISGEGKVTAVPDIATVSIGLQTQKAKVSDAQAENTKKMNAIITKLQELGIAKADLQTSSYNIWPQYDYVNGTQVQHGFMVSQSVDVKIRKLDAVGDVLAAAGTLGANQVGGVNFTIDDPEKIRQEARLKALEAAKVKAKALADAAGVKLGKVVGFSESVSGGGPMPIFYAKADAASGMGGAPSPSVEPGSQDVVVDVTVNYEILP
jgi:uncharacterized protein YggE